MESVVAREPKGQYVRSAGVLHEDPFVMIDSIGNVPPFWFDDASDVNGYWVVTRYEDAREVLRDHATFSAVNQAIPWVQLDDPMLPAFVDPPETQKYRAILLREMGPAKMAKLRPRMEEICDAVVARFAADGRCDVATDFAQAFPIAMFLEIFGLPRERREEFRYLAAMMNHDRNQDAWSHMRRIVDEQIIEKRENPADDLLSVIANAEIDGAALSSESAASLAATVFIGGLDTVPASITYALRYLAQNAEVRSAIAQDPTVCARASEEFLRFYSIVGPRRSVTRDIDFHGARMRAGDRVRVSIPNADRDEAVFQNAASIDIDRPKNPHMAFGLAAHRCLGINLARPELEIALRTWHAAIPDYRLSDAAATEFATGVFSIMSLPLEWDPSEN